MRKDQRGPKQFSLLAHTLRLQVFGDRSKRGNLPGVQRSLFVLTLCFVAGKLLLSAETCHRKPLPLPGLDERSPLVVMRESWMEDV